MPDKIWVIPNGKFAGLTLLRSQDCQADNSIFFTKCFFFYLASLVVVLTPSSHPKVEFTFNFASLFPFVLSTLFATTINQNSSANRNVNFTRLLQFTILHTTTFFSYGTFTFRTAWKSHNIYFFTICRLSDKMWAIPNGTFTGLTLLRVYDCWADTSSFKVYFPSSKNFINYYKPPEHQIQCRLHLTFKFTLVSLFPVCRLSDKMWAIPNGTFTGLTLLRAHDCQADNS